MATMESGTKFGNYTIEGLIAGGGMGTVYAARDDLYGSTVALKVLHPQLHEDEDWRIRFNLEAVIGQQLKHPHVVAARELIEHEKSVGIVLDLVGGGLTLHRVISREYPQGLELEYALKLFLGIVQGVEYAHSKNVSHGDLKPENVLLAGNHAEIKSWVPKVTDFGTVGIMAHPVIIDGRPAVVVSPRYASPEHLLGLDRIEPRSDVYCLGLLLHYLVCGKHASTAANVEEAARNISRPVPMVALVDHPEAVIAVIKTATSMALDDRYQNCRELAIAVRGVLDAIGAKLDLEDVAPDLATEVMDDRADMKASLYDDLEETGIPEETEPPPPVVDEDAPAEADESGEGAEASDAPDDESDTPAEPSDAAADGDQDDQDDDGSRADGPSTMAMEAALAKPPKKSWDDLSKTEQGEAYDDALKAQGDDEVAAPWGPPQWVWVAAVGLILVVGIPLVLSFIQYKPVNDMSDVPELSTEP